MPCSFLLNLKYSKKYFQYGFSNYTAPCLEFHILSGIKEFYKQFKKVLFIVKEKNEIVEDIHVILIKF